MVGALAEPAGADAAAVGPLAFVKNSCAVFAANDLFSGLYPRRSRRRDFHMTAGANTVLHRDDCCIAFAVEEPFELVEQIGVDSCGKSFSLLFQFLLLSLQRY